MSTVYTVTCPHCGGQMNSPPELAGVAVNCPHCQGAFTMPLQPVGQVQPPQPPPVQPPPQAPPQISPTAPPSRPVSDRLRGLVHGRKPGRVRLIIRLSIWFIVIPSLFLIGTLCKEAGSEEMGLPFLLAGLLLCIPRLNFWLANELAAMMVNTIVCRSCGFERDAVGQWAVGQYADHKERHILRVKSPIDGTVVGHTECPNCGVTIMIQ